MTLIASTRNYKFPFLLSDILWTVQDEKRKVNKIIRSEEKQKMYIINDSACVIFAGYSGEIGNFLRALKDKFQDKKITHNRLHKFLSGYKLDINFSNSALYLTYFQNLKGTKKIVHQFYFPKEPHLVDKNHFTINEGKWNIMQDDVFDEVSACASGAKEFLSHIEEERLEIRTQSQKGDFLHAIQANTIVISKELLRERSRDRDYVANNVDWGRGYEAAFYDGRKFNKVDDIAYALCYGESDQFGKVHELSPRLIVYNRYIGDTLYITELGLDNFSKSESESHWIMIYDKGNFKVTNFGVPPLDKTIRKTAKPDLYFDTNQIAMAYYIRIRPGYHYNPAFYNIGGGVTVSYLKSETVIVTVDKRFDENIKNVVESKFG
jgi:hypothetical protein